MLTYILDPKDKKPLYEQLYLYIKEDISKGFIKKGERLPSKRSIATHHNISLITVETAYGQLEAEGYISSFERRGYFVSDLDFLLEERPISSMNEKLVSLDIEKVSKKKEINKKEKIKADFVSNAIDIDNFPLSIWTRITREILSDSQSFRETMESVPFQGLYDLRKAICDHLLHFRAIECKAENVIIGAGTEYLYNLLIRYFGQDQVIALEDPGYEKPYLIYKNNGVRCIHLDVKEDGMDTEALFTSNASMVHITPAHHFPTGVVMPINKRIEILRWAEQYKAYIIEDDYDSEFRMEGKPIAPLKSIDKDHRVIYMNTFTKTISPAIRVAYMVLPDYLNKDFLDKLNFYSNTVAVMEQKILANFILSGHFEKHINRMRTFYKKKRDQLIEAIDKNFKGLDYEIIEHNSGLHFILGLKTDLEDTDVIARAKNKGLKISAVSSYRHKKKDSSGEFIINYSGESLEKAIKGIEVLAGIFKKSL